MRSFARGLVAVLALASCTTVLAAGTRDDEPVQLSGAGLPDLVGTAVGDLAVFVWDPDATAYVPIPFQVDERVAPAGDADRNLTHLRSALLERVPLEPGRVHAMPVEARDLEGAALQYARTLAADAGTPAVLDLVHLGLGRDGHTASLVPGSSALEETASDVAVTEPYLGHRRMTLTFPVLDRARRVLWVVTGAGKAGVLQRLQAGDRTIPAGRVERGRALVLADRAAAGTAD